MSDDDMSQFTLQKIRYQPAGFKIEQVIAEKAGCVMILAMTVVLYDYPTGRFACCTINSKRAGRQFVLLFLRITSSAFKFPESVI